MTHRVKPRQRRVGAFPLMAFSLTLVLFFSLLASLVPAPAWGLEPRQGLVQAPDSPRPADNATPCGALSSTYGNLTGIPYASNFTAIFAELCKTTSFITLYDDGLNASGIFAIWTTSYDANPPNLTFALLRLGPCTMPSPGYECTFEAVWLGYLNNDSFSGPYLQEYVATSAGGLEEPTWPSFLPDFSTPPTLAIGAAALIVAGVTIALVRKRGNLRVAMLCEYDGPDDEGITPSLGPAGASDSEAIEHIF
jgi:hypothetical protein